MVTTTFRAILLLVSLFVQPVVSQFFVYKSTKSVSFGVGNVTDK